MSTLEQTLRPMCVEGAELIRKPLPVYPHCMMVWSEQEGMEMVQRMGSGRAVLLQGHGATMAGNSLEQVVMGMFNLEEQAKMNYLAYCAEGPGHKSIPEPLLEEWFTRPPQEELPHFKSLMQEIGGNPPRNGPWLYYRERAIAALKGM
jgi:ribulose-5-phosphate 4-epimerase/fuculose-1-phosphate aldolase